MSTSAPTARHFKPCGCSIIPPFILSHIAQSQHNSHEIRQSAQQTLAHTRTLLAARAAGSTAQQSAPSHGPPHQGIVPQHILQNIAQSDENDDETRMNAQRTLEHDTLLRGHRGGASGPSDVEKGKLHREIHDAHHSFDNAALPGKLIRAEGSPATSSQEEAVTDTYDNLGAVYEFYSKFFHRNSIDDKGLPLIGSIHYGKNYGNAFWNSQQMVFGDGDKFIYNFTKSLDVIGHELTHGVTEKTCGLNYQNQSGALNESVSDCFGIMVKQYKENTTAADADWLIGEGCLFPGVKGVALRSMKAPGTAFDDPRIGKDPQPATMKDYADLPNDENNDNGGVHTNSGIPNHAFYLCAVGFGGHSWEKAGQVWYATLNDGGCNPDIDFKGFADITCKQAGKLFGKEGEDVVRKAWTDVAVYS